MTLLLLTLFFGCGSAGQAEFEAGVKATRSGDQSAAVASFVSALEAGGRDSATYHGLGNALYREGQAGEAVAAWRRGVRRFVVWLGWGVELLRF